MFGFARGRRDRHFFGANESIDCGGFSNVGVADKADLCSAGVGWICGLGVVCGVLEYRGNR